MPLIDTKSIASHYCNLLLLIADFKVESCVQTICLQSLMMTSILLITLLTLNDDRENNEVCSVS